MNWFSKKQEIILSNDYETSKASIKLEIALFLEEQAKLPRVKLVANLENGSVVDSSDIEPETFYINFIFTSLTLKTKKEVANTKRHLNFINHYFLTKDDIAIPMNKVKDIRIIEY